MTTLGGVMRWRTYRWEKLPGQLTHVSVGADGTAWGLDANGVVLRWRPAERAATGHQGEWESVDTPSPMESISVAHAGKVWGATANSEVYWWDGEWNLEAVRPLQAVSVGSDGAVYGRDADGFVYARAFGGVWKGVPGRVQQIAVGDAGNVLAVTAKHRAFALVSGSWRRI